MCNHSKFELQYESVGNQVNRHIVDRVISANVKMNLNDLDYTHSQWYLSDEQNRIEFKEYYMNNHVYMISALGTGKTEILR